MLTTSSAYRRARIRTVGAWTFEGSFHLPCLRYLHRVSDLHHRFVVLPFHNRFVCVSHGVYYICRPVNRVIYEGSIFVPPSPDYFDTYDMLPLKYLQVYERMLDWRFALLSGGFHCGIAGASTRL